MASLEITSNSFSIEPNIFSTANRYIRQPVSTNSATLWATRTRSMDIRVETSGQSSYSWRFECGPYTVTGVATASAPAQGFATDQAVVI